MEELGMAMGQMFVWVMLIVLIVALAGRGRGFLNPLRGLQMRWASGKLGLWPRSRLTQPELDELDDLPLCCFARWCKFTFSGWVLEGRVGGCPVRLFDMLFEGKFRDAQDKSWNLLACQTVAVVYRLDVPWCFHRGPSDTLWDRLSPGWPAVQGLMSSLTFPGRRGSAPAVIHVEGDRGVEAVLPGRLVDDLADLDDWVVECGGGLVMVYRHEQRVAPANLAEVLETVRYVVDVLADSLEELPPLARPVSTEQGDRRIQESPSRSPDTFSPEADEPPSSAP